MDSDELIDDEFRVALSIKFSIFEGNEFDWKQGKWVDKNDIGVITSDE
jgi:hypothetical protein